MTLAPCIVTARLSKCPTSYRFPGGRIFCSACNHLTIMSSIHAYSCSHFICSLIIASIPSIPMLPSNHCPSNLQLLPAPACLRPHARMWRTLSLLAPWRVGPIGFTLLGLACAAVGSSASAGRIGKLSQEAGARLGLRRGNPDNLSRQGVQITCAIPHIPAAAPIP